MLAKIKKVVKLGEHMIKESRYNVILIFYRSVNYVYLKFFFT